jgi:putative ABC transport system ATP-binding protein
VSAAVRIDNVAKAYRLGGETLRVLAGLSLEVTEGRFVALMGPSGSGKSTLLNLIGGLDRPDSGRVVVGDSDISTWGEAALARWRAAHIGFVFQQYNLLPVLTAFENVELPLLLTSLSRAERRRRAELALELVALQDRMRHLPTQLSGGQQQRVCIARAVVSDPQVILADEPTGNLDAASAREVLELLQAVNRTLGKTLVLVTHDPAAAACAHETVTLDKGVIREVSGARG